MRAVQRLRRVATRVAARAKRATPAGAGTKWPPVLLSILPVLPGQPLLQAEAGWGSDAAATRMLAVRKSLPFI